MHPRFRNGKALSTLWLNLAPKVLWSMRAKYLMGCVSIHLQDNLARAYYTHRQIQQLPDTKTIDIRSKKSMNLNIRSLVSSRRADAETIPNVFEYAV